MGSRRRRTDWGTVAREGAKYATVGAVGYVLDVTLSNFFLLVAGWGPLVAKTLSTLASMAVNYVGNRNWSFRERRPAGGAAEIGSFLAVNLCGLLIVLMFVGFARYVMDLEGTLAFNLVANVLGAGVAAVFSFWACGRFVFRTRAVGRHALRAVRAGRPVAATIPAPRSGAHAPRPAPAPAPAKVTSGGRDVRVATLVTYR